MIATLLTIYLFGRVNGASPVGHYVLLWTICNVDIHGCQQRELAKTLEMC